MFTVEQIERAHGKVKSGAEFPKYIQEIKDLGVTEFETWVFDSHTLYFGKNSFHTKSEPKYDELIIADTCDKAKFETYIKIHQKGETGIEKWVANLDRMTCIYYDKEGNDILTEVVPSK